VIRGEEDLLIRRMEDPLAADQKSPLLRVMNCRDISTSLSLESKVKRPFSFASVCSSLDTWGFAPVPTLQHLVVLVFFVFVISHQFMKQVFDDTVSHVKPSDVATSHMKCVTF
jgi:hypothetical protein